MSRARVAAPRVYEAIAAITAELAETGIAKRQVNETAGYAYRGIEDVLKALAPLLARHRLCVLPRVLERVVADRQNAKGELLVSVSLKVAFDLVSARDGSLHTIEAWAEALDEGDKATAKAMSAAYKQALLQAFCVPVAGIEEADATAQRLKPCAEPPDPVQGWEQWAADLEEMVRLCETPEALDRVQETYRALLRAASKRCPELFVRIGKVAGQRRADLATAVLVQRDHANSITLHTVPAHG